MSDQVKRSDGVHPLFEEVIGYSLAQHISHDVLRMLADMSQENRIFAVEKAIQCRMDPQKDEELLHWFRLLKRVYALEIEIIEDSRMIAGAEIQLWQPFPCPSGNKNVGVRYRAHLKTLYTKLPDTRVDEVNSVPVYALPETRAWILSEIANGWSPWNYTEQDKLDCLIFLSVQTKGWNEIQKCVRNLLRELSKKFSEKQIAEYLKSQILSETVFTALIHALVARVAKRDSGREALRVMIKSVTW